MKICIVSSCGGHLTEVRRLAGAFKAYDHFYVLNDHALLPADMRNKTYFITHSERDWKLIVNLWEAFRILRRERPDIILSTGAGPAVPFAIIGRFFLRSKVIFVETLTSVERPSLTGRIMYYIAHHFYYQWPELQDYFSKGEYGGPLV